MVDEIVRTKGLLVGGKWVAGEREIEVRNPASTEEVVGICSAASARQAEAAIEAAWQAFPAWSRMNIEERANILTQAVQPFMGAMQELGRLLTREQGRVLSEATLVILAPVMIVGSTAGIASQLAEPVTISDDRGWMMVRKEPVGVVSCITPWNYPIFLTWAPVASALIAGNTVVIKPSSYTPLTVAKTMEIVADLLPPGVINLVPGSATEVGRVLTTHSRVRMVSFTGSCDTGTQVMIDAAATKKKLNLELGGNDAAIVLPDVDWSQDTFSRLCRGVYMNTGQVCMAIKRIYVHESIFQKFVDAFIDVASQIVVGNGLDERSQMGPLNNAEQLNKVTELVKEAERRGAKVVRTGKKLDPSAFKRGYFHLPTIITGADASFGIVSQEQFGPAIPIMPFKDDEEAIRLANDTPFALGSSVWTTDEERGVKIAVQLEAGYTWINQHSVLALEPAGPYGGWKESGLGRTYGLEGLQYYTETHVIVNKKPLAI